ncbi:MAG: hypothetical protein IKN73_02990 [Alphaproteobacteria bacterium]|nr:hypothetical protein [Alphaproteobacteria bacterium]
MSNTKNHIYGIIGLVGLFLVGGMLGYTLNGSGHLRTATMSKSDCRDISNQIIRAAANPMPNPEFLAQLNKVYSENCVDRIFEQPKPQPKPEVKKLSEINCEAVEELLKQTLNDENTTNIWDHDRNATIYERIAREGCEKNKDKYIQLANRERKMAKALDIDNEMVQENRIPDFVPVTTCGKIESELLPRLICKDTRYHSCNESEHVNDAKIYANLSERGCPENSEKYKNLAKQELEIARALTDDNIEHNPEESVEIVETYKRLQMQAEAERMIEKAKKIANPAIDFIIQLEKIIEE